MATTPDPTTAALIAARVKTQLSKLIGTDAYEDLRDEIHDSLVAAQAEGYADAALLAGHTDDIAATYDEAAKVLMDSASLWSATDVYLASFLTAVADEIGSQVSKGLTAGQTQKEIANSIQSILDGTTGSAAMNIGDSMAASMSASSLNWYQTNGIDQVNWLTAGDAAVCEDCEDEEDGNPYAANEVDSPPLHNNCRCCLAPANED